jgi:hypothetical protein
MTHDEPLVATPLYNIDHQVADVVREADVAVDQIGASRRCVIQSDRMRRSTLKRAAGRAACLCAFSLGDAALSKASMQAPSAKCEEVAARFGIDP